MEEVSPLIPFPPTSDKGNLSLTVSSAYSLILWAIPAAQPGSTPSAGPPYVEWDTPMCPPAGEQVTGEAVATNLGESFPAVRLVEMEFGSRSEEELGG